MKPEAQRIAIAGACGYTDIISPGGYPQGITIIGDDAGYQRLPDYPNDLNAIHEAEKVILLDPFNTTENDVMETAMVLAERALAYQTMLFSLQPGLPSSICHFTAAQRCEALVRTLEKWVDSENDRTERQTPGCDHDGRKNV